MPEQIPFLQVVHISDLHFVRRGFAPRRDPTLIRSRIRAVGRMAPARIRALFDGLDRSLRDGLAGSLPSARRAFEHFWPKITEEDPVFGGLPTWLVQTGDLTTWGDVGSLDDAMAFVDRIAARESRLSLYGNHDAWPETLPILGRERIPDQERRIAERFPGPWPCEPLRVALPDGSGEVVLRGIDTVSFQFWQNTWARGRLPAEQAEALAAEADGRPGERRLQLLACHHPLRYPDESAAYAMVLARQDEACRGLRPPALMVLSGHTHDLFPRDLPSDVRDCDHAPLGRDQCQLVVGSLAQAGFGDRDELAQHFQILRFHQDAEAPSMIAVHRMVAVRISGSAGVSVSSFAVPDLPGFSQTMELEI